MVVVATSAVFVVAGDVAHAKDDSVNNSSNTLQISPVRTSNLVVAPGGTGKVTITVSNLTQSDMTLEPIENDFVASGEGGTPALILDENKYAPTHSLKRFMQPLDLVIVPAGERKKVDLIIKVPKDAQAGGYYGALRFQPVRGSADPAANTTVQASAASLILMTVPGPMTEKLTVTNFDIRQDGKSATNFRSPNDLSLFVRMKNYGNVHEGPFGSVTVKRGDDVVYTYKFNNYEPRDMILPDTARQWTIPLKNIDSWGQYTVTGVFTYGQKNETFNLNVSFWVIPWTVIIVSIVGVLVLIGLIVGIWLFLRSYKRRILNKHSGGRRGGYRR